MAKRYKVSFSRYQVWECDSVPTTWCRGSFFAWLYRLKGDGRDAFVCDARYGPDYKVTNLVSFRRIADHQAVLGICAERDEVTGNDYVALCFWRYTLSIGPHSPARATK